MNPEPSEMSKELFRLVVENVKDFAIYTKDLQGRILSWNPGVERLLGYAESEWIGQHISIIFTPEDRERGALAHEMRTALAEGRAEDQRWHLRKDGSRFWANGLLMLLRGEAGEPRAFAKILRDDTARKRAEEELRRAHDELERRVEERTRELSRMSQALQGEVEVRRESETQVKELLRRIIDAQEVERRKIARDLHDHFGQLLTALGLKLQSIKEGCRVPAEACEQVEQAQQLLRRLDAEVDFLAWELRPAALDKLGLAAALDTFVQEWTAHCGIPAEFHDGGLSGTRLAPEVEINIYRIAQEALNNIYKHAEATRVDVIIERRDNLIVVIIEDNGKGFSPNAVMAGDRGMGLLNMRERADQIGGKLEIESEPGAGTAVYARVPSIFLDTGMTAPPD